jgi:hypothetical protein
MLQSNQRHQKIENSVGIKEEAHKLIDNLPADFTWEDLMRAIYVRQSIESGLADSEANRVIEVEQVRKEFGLQI